MPGCEIHISPKDFQRSRAELPPPIPPQISKAISGQHEVVMDLFETVRSFSFDRELFLHINLLGIERIDEQFSKMFVHIMFIKVWSKVIIIFWYSIKS